MKDQDTRDRFVQLRAQGWSYNRIATELTSTNGPSNPSIIFYLPFLCHVLRSPFAPIRVIRGRPCQSLKFEI
ncbi:MAG: hypothetical protein WCO56_05130 [Verrucomicrobiota bacterium]